ncbi:hypothetical protein MRB53_022231 [Persea americana]|uniref:Uncharacterized protein n=1 Tax=Persea americana TaxID=3435 RepID=A0ACC2L6A9_PERAE|nr:hypothetical protein MRB53_022231 [Persea americana]
MIIPTSSCGSKPLISSGKKRRDKVQGFWDDKSSLLSEAMLNYAFDLRSRMREKFAEQMSDILAQGGGIMVQRSTLLVMKFLVKNTKVDVSAVNKNGLTPLDVLLENPLGIGRLKTQWLLACAGAKRARSIYHHTETEKKMDGCHGRWFIQALLAVVMVIVTFQAGLYPPGGVWQDTGYHNATLFSPYAVESSPPTLVHHYAGKSVLSYVDPKRYKYFSFFNDVAFYSSALVIVLLLRRGHLHSGALKILLTISVLAMCVSSFCLISFSSPDGRFGARSWTTYTGVVALLFPAEALDKLVVRFKKDLVPQMIGHFLTPP